jgi:putative RNA 2'-phosphotransferase
VSRERRRRDEEPSNDVRRSKRLALALRHDPTALGLTLDEAGWANVADVLAGFSAIGDALTIEQLRALVASSDKRRFAFSEDGASLRANQGHSLDVELALAVATPPAVLLHGTVSKVVEAIRRDGLVRGSRKHVHLSAELETATSVARRRRGPHVVFRVRALEMQSAGFSFFLSDNGVWLVDHVPARFLDETVIELA